LKGSYNIVLTKSGYEPKNVTTSVIVDQTNTVEITLSKTQIVSSDMLTLIAIVIAVIITIVVVGIIFIIRRKNRKPTENETDDNKTEERETEAWAP
jgi:heme/copper-type cytochrome/quinol oxidase subunit 2